MVQERVLVVDDAEAVRGVVGAMLERSGYAATLAEGGEEALMLLREGPDYDLVLSDIMMPGTDGLTLLHRICLDHPGTPVVMVTAVQDVHVATNAFRSGAIDFLMKPFARAQLEAVVTRAMEHGQLMKQNAAYRQNLEAIVSSRTSRLRATMEDLERSYDARGHGGRARSARRRDGGAFKASDGVYDCAGARDGAERGATEGDCAWCVSA